MQTTQLRQLTRLSSLFNGKESDFLQRFMRIGYSSVAHDLDTLIAQRRDGSGSIAATKFRRQDQIPGILFSLPKEDSILLTFNKKDISYALGKLGRTGWACHIFNVKVPLENQSDEFETYRAIGRQVHLTAATDAIENITLMHCPPERRVRVNVPLKIFGEEICPGLKAGGRINWIERTISCTARGDAIPDKFEIDISKLIVNDKMYFTDLKLPEGVDLAVKDINQPIIKIQRK